AAFVDLRQELLDYQHNFYCQIPLPSGGYLVDGDGDPGRTTALAELLGRHSIVVQRSVQPGAELYVPLGQRQHQLVSALFEPLLDFEDSLFYDVSTWHLPSLFNLPTLKVAQAPVWKPRLEEKKSQSTTADYAYFLPWDDYYAPRAAYQLLARGLRLKVSHQPLETAEGHLLGRGALMLTVANQAVAPAEVQRIVAEVSAETGFQMLGTNQGSVNSGRMLGSREAFSTLRQPSVLLLVGAGVSSLDAGEVWHLLDQRYRIPVTKMELEDLGHADLSRYNTIVMVDGNYSSLGQGRGLEKLKGWLSPGRVLIAQQGGARWAAANGLAKLTLRHIDAPSPTAVSEGQRPYEKAERDAGARGLGGAVFTTSADLTHPLLYGYRRSELPVFRSSTLLFEPSANVYATPLRYQAEPLLSGYAPQGFNSRLAGSAAVVVSGVNRGHSICFADNPNFRALAYGTNRLFINALFFGHTLNSATLE
ncbi:MAG: zinc carboxypeptidase, partial [Lewinella sp.]|nr:zinc carboxypeptidase [Lewinella sp.]